MGDTAKGSKAFVTATSSSSSNSNAYKSFKDVPLAGYSGGWEYEGDAAEQLKFFGQYSNYDELINGMSSATHTAFEHWMRGDFMSGSQYLGWDYMDDEEQRWTRAYDRVLDRATLDRGVIVRRLTDAQFVMGAGHSTATLDELKAQEGRIITSPANMSTGAAAQGLAISNPSRTYKTVEYRISIPGGTKGAGMWIGDYRIGGWGPKQREFMINRDTQFRVGKTTFDKSRGVYIVDLKYIGRTKHDYGFGSKGHRY